MARLPRLAVAGLPHYLIQRGHGGLPVLPDAVDRDAFLAALEPACVSHRVALHAYALLPGEVHLLVTPAEGAALGRMVQAVGRRYATGFNRRHQRRGGLWEGRFRAAVIHPERWVLACLCHIESLPVQAGLAGRAGDWAWSSHAHHAGRRADPLVTDPPAFWALGNTPFEREAAYRSLFEHGVEANDARRLVDAALKGWPLGPPEFLATLAERTGRRLEPGRRGRPRRTAHNQDKSVPK